MFSFVKKHAVALALVSSFVLAPAAVFWFTDIPVLSRAHIAWMDRFERDITESEEVSLGDLVTFEWEKIYLIQTYDPLDTSRREKLFPTGYKFLFWWEHRRPYWTIAYQRPHRTPFLVRMEANRWYLRNMTNLWTTDRLAKLTLVKPNTVESTYCGGERSGCLALLHERSPTPAKPYY
jgi:hypothetical protein